LLVGNGFTMWVVCARLFAHTKWATPKYDFPTFADSDIWDAVSCGAILANWRAPPVHPRDTFALLKHTPGAYRELG